MKHSLVVLAAVGVIVAGPHTALASVQRSPGPTTSEVSAIVGSWHRSQTCSEMLAAFEAAGLAESHVGWLQGNFFGGEPGPTEGDVCAGAQGPLEHSHFFTDEGAFGSLDESGEQVDDGDYVVVDEDTLAFPSHATEFGFDGDLVVDYEIDAGTVTFDVALPEPCVEACADAYAWALSAFASGSWTRGGGDAGRIVFQRAPGGEVVEANETDVYVMTDDGNDERLLTAGAEPGRWSPDGSEVSIFCCDDPGMVAHFVDVTTGEVRGVGTPDPTLELHCEYGWSPDGERLLCEGYGIDDPSRNGIYSVRASDGGDLTQITSNPAGGDVPGTYSPDGAHLVFKRFEDDVPVGMFVIDISDDGGAGGQPPRHLTPAGMVLDDTGHGGRWSPDGEQILFVARESEGHHKAIYLQDLGEDGDGAIHQLPIAPGCGGPLGEADAYGCYAPDWSPDGERIVFTRSEPDGSNESIWIVNVDGSGLVQLTDGTDDIPAWEPSPSTT
jgi:dipeptidyl aminopeptidase/acylaminoacyl peptidase